MQHGDPSPHPRIYFGVDDIDGAIARVRELGGSAAETITIPAGSFARCVDDHGVQFALFEARKQ